MINNQIKKRELNSLSSSLMLIKKIDFTELYQLNGSKPVLFIRPLLCKTVRVYPLHQSHKLTKKFDEITKLLDLTSSYFNHGIWHYYPHHSDRLHMALQHLFLMGIENMLCEEGSPFGYDHDKNPVQEILN